MGPCASSAAPHQPAACLTRTDVANPEALVIPTRKGSIQDCYSLDSKVLGKGTYGIVTRGTHPATGAVHAIKMVRHTGKRIIRALHREIAIMKAMDHPHIVKLFEAVEDHQCTYLAMELCEGGELLDAIIAAKYFPENQGARIMQQILRAVRYVHSKEIAHRDLKPENFLLQRKGPLEANSLKLIDFGFACPCKPGHWLKTCAGSPMYVAPEVLMGRYDKQCDLWSVGVVMYALLSGRAPFSGHTEAEIFAKVHRGRVHFEGSSWRRVSTNAKDLIHQLLKMNPSGRLTAQEALRHPWIVHRVPEVRKVTEALSLESGLVERLRGFCACNKLERAVLKVIARHLSEDKVKDLRAAFEALDANGDGRPTMEEFRSGLESAGFENAGLDVPLILAMMTDSSGDINYSEFLAATLDRRRVLTDEALRAAFHVFDRNGDGCICQQDLSQVLCSGDRRSPENCERLLELLHAVDLSGAGLIDFRTFRRMMLRMQDVSRNGGGQRLPRHCQEGARGIRRRLSD